MGAKRPTAADRQSEGDGGTVVLLFGDDIFIDLDGLHLAFGGIGRLGLLAHFVVLQHFVIDHHVAVIIDIFLGDLAVFPDFVAFAPFLSRRRIFDFFDFLSMLF